MNADFNIRNNLTIFGTMSSISKGKLEPFVSQSTSARHPNRPPLSESLLHNRNLPYTRQRNAPRRKKPLFFIVKIPDGALDNFKVLLKGGVLKCR
jgi:hypothetical protein